MPEKVRVDDTIPIPPAKFYHLLDKLSRVDELLEVLIKQMSAALEKLDTIAGIPPPPPPPPAPPIPVPLSTIEVEPPTIITGQKSVATKSIAEIMINRQKTRAIFIKANNTNTGKIYIGTAGVSPTTGIVLSPYEAIGLCVDLSISEIWINADNAGDGASFLILK